MQEPHRYALDKSSKKYICPECDKKKFVRYVDSTTDEYLPDRYGRCDREDKCQYHLSPKADGYAKMIWEQERGQYRGDWKPAARISPTKPPPKIDPVFVPPDVLKATLKDYAGNVFLQNLMERVRFPFSHEDIEKVVSQYYLGTVSRGDCAGAITFPYIDIQHRTRAIQVKKFDNHNHTTRTTSLTFIIEQHHRKKNKPLPDWLECYQKNDKKFSCLFGEHLLNKYPSNPVALVEAPKTAVYASLYFGFPDDPKKLLWLAVYNLSSLNYAKCQALKGRRVVLFPDLSKDGHAFKKWSARAKELQSLIPGSRFIVSDLLEVKAQPQQREKGADLADYLIKLDWRKLRNESNGQPQPPPPDGVGSVKSVAGKTSFLPDEVAVLYQPVMDTFTNYAGEKVTNAINEDGYPASWDRPAIFVNNRN